MALTTHRPSAPQPDRYDDRDHRPRYRGPHPAAVALPVFLAAVLGVVATVFVALHTSFGQHDDEAAMRVLHSSRSAANAHLVGLLQQVSVVSAAFALATMIAVALVRRRFRVALAAVVLVVGANLTTEILKNFVITRPDLGLNFANDNGTTTIANSLPSGHTTVVFSLVLAAILVSPRLLRWFVTLGAAAVGGLTGLATVIAGWHRPSDVVAALLVTLAWAALVSAVVAGSPRDGIRGHSGSFAALLGGGLAALGVIIYGFGWTGGPDVSRVIPLTSAVIAAVAAACVGSYATLVARTSN